MTLAVPLSVRLRTARADYQVTPDLRRLRYRHVIPGGFASAELELDRPLSLAPSEIASFGSLFVYDGRHGGVVWQGRVEDPGRGASADGEIWSITGTGPSAHGRDRTVPLIYIDRTLDRWFPMSGQTHAVQLGREGQQDGGLQLHVALGQNLGTGATNGWSYFMLDETNQKLARVRADWDAAITDADYVMELLVETSGGSVTSIEADPWHVDGGSLVGTKPANWPGTDQVGARIRMRPNGVNPPAVPDSSHSVVVDNIAIRSILKNNSGADIVTGYTQDYVLAHEIVKDLLGRLLPKFDGAKAAIDETSTFQITQLAYPDGVSPAAVLEDLMRLESEFYWAAWEGEPARFEWTKWPTTIRYEARATDGFDSPAAGVDLYNAVSVRWLAPSGKIRTNRRTQSVAVLDDAGLTREAMIDVGDNVSSSAQADRIGDQFLSDHAVAPNRGVLTIRQPIVDYKLGRTVQPWELVPGGLIRVRDVLPRADALNVSDRDAVTIFRVTAVEYDAETNAASLTLDSTPQRLPHMLAQREFLRRR